MSKRITLTEGMYFKDRNGIEYQITRLIMDRQTIESGKGRKVIIANITFPKEAPQELAEFDLLMRFASGELEIVLTPKTKIDPNTTDLRERIRRGDFDVDPKRFPYPPKHLDPVDRKRMFEARQREHQRLLEEFKRAALEYVGLAGHPKAERIYAYAWEQGHSSGLSEVLHYLEDLAELFLD